MKLSKKDLLAFIDSAIENLAQAHLKKEGDLIDRALEEADDWERVWGHVWDDTIALLYDARAKHEPITEAMFTKVRNSYINLRCFGGFHEVTEYTVPSDLRGMKALVEAVSDEVIDMKALSVGDVRDLFRKYGGK